jgi:alkylation response protein AidB-like acyl-CoA dehydrogenase
VTSLDAPRSAPDTETNGGDAEQRRVQKAVDALLAAHDPANTDPIEFRRARYDAGLAWVHFPDGFGGLAVRPELNRTVEEQVRRAGARPTDPRTFFMELAGPTIVTHGTDEQKRRLLPPMYTGEEVWCQLFSEPGAGSDFAGLGTRAVRDGDEWVINGQKVWNTLAHLADRGMLVTRSHPDLPKHKGMTYFALDMHAPGVEVRPLRQITGEAEFNEVYLTDVRIPDANRIGDEGDGWRVSLTTLMNERVAIGSGSGPSAPRRGGGALPAVQVWNDLPEHARTATRREQLMKLWSAGEVHRLTMMRASTARRAGNPGPEGSVGKVASADLNKRVFDFCIDLLGAEGLVGYDFTFRRPEDLGVTGEQLGVRHAFLRTRANSIEGGTSEIMRNILGEQVLGLPGEPRVDKDVAWSEVPRN